MTDLSTQAGSGEPSTPPTAAELLLAAGRPIAIVVATATALAVVVSFLLPKWYDSTTTLLPPKNQTGLQGLGGVGSLLKDFIPMSAAKGLQQGGAYSYLALLNSRREQEAIIRKFDLARVYDVDNSSTEEALKEFQKNFGVKVSDDGTIGITVSDRDSVRAAEMANYAVAVLNILNAELGATESRGNRQFLEKRVKEFKDSLSAAEEALAVYQEEHGMVILSDEAKSAANAYVSLYAARVEADIELSVLRKTVGTDNQVYEQKKLAYDELSSRLDKFPRMGMESLRLFRQLLVNQKILEILLPLYEQAKFEEVKDVPAVVVLDVAVPAEKKSRPVRSLIVLTAFAASSIFCAMFVLWRDRLRALLARQRMIMAALGHPGRGASRSGKEPR
jgi:tyrosine-protein kinase Etk/Wzc